MGSCTRKFANKLMTDTSGKINSPSIQDIYYLSPSNSETCNVVTSCGLFSVHNILFIPKASIKPEKCFYTLSKGEVITRTSTFTFLVCKQSLLIH